MELTTNQRTALLELTTKSEASIQIAERLRLPKEWRSVSSVNQSLKDLMREGLVQANPLVPGLYRLTIDGTTIKELELGENQ
ncbi:MarR family transcriptional regulator [Peribacillus butanolivorans]|uniref:MarR family transcriptional regulator n=1 Tax=Peribacillus butanolivorans TaxID=421767 RepID=A0ABN5NBX5_9BACI|nr:MarR family transcriptional regulator [Peribacillus butanolivorans]AXN40827.1 MarR family transcriptional regulator [Peribacillus butanolivorans]